MKKDVRSLISEAFEELYQELINEVVKSSIENHEINNFINNAIQKGSPIPYNFASEDKKSRDNFNTIIDAIVDDYKATGNPNAKKSLQATFYPVINSKLYKIIGTTFVQNPNMEDAAAAAYEQVVINNLDKVISAYQAGTKTFSGLLANDMKNKVYNYIVKGHRGAEDGGSQLDVMAGGDEVGGKPVSLDAPINNQEDGDTYGSRVGDAENAGIEQGPDTLGGEIGNSLGTGAETAMERGFEKEKKIATQKRILKDVIEWLDNKFEETGDAVGKKRMIAFKGLMNGDSAEEIFEDNPGVFPEPRLVTDDFNLLIASKEAKEISEMISRIYGINFNLANIDAKKLKQTSSMKPEFGGFSKIVKIATPEMKAAQQELNSALGVVGLKSTDFNSESKKEKVISHLQSQGKGAELEAILDAEENLRAVSEKAKALGKYDVKTALLPSSAEEEAEAGEMFEGIDINKLMERVYKRLTQ